MAVTITEILETDEIAASRITLNNNFSALKSAVDTITGTYLDTTSGDLTVNSATVQKLSTDPYTTVGLTVENSGSVVGNLGVGQTLTTNSLVVTNGVTVSGGNISLTNSANKISTTGGLSVGGSVVQTGFSNAFTPAYDQDSYATVSGTTGNLVTAGTGVFLLQWTSAYDPANTADGYNIKDVRLPNTGDIGQRITLVTTLNSNVTNTDAHYLMAPVGGTILGVDSSTVGNEGILICNNDSSVGSDLFNSCLELAWTGSQWLILNLYGATIQTM
jgi:hypothetical protein